MRQALNENPVVQAAVIGIVGIAFAVIFFMQMGGGGDSGGSTVADPVTTPPVETATTASTAPAPATGDSAAATPVVPPSTSEGSAGAAGSPGSASAGTVRPGKGIPGDVLAAYRSNKAVALLVVDPKGASSPLIKRSTKRLAETGDAAVFVVPASRIARYARITAGLPVTRVPALVVVRPRKLSGDQPTASVSYGFRGPRSVRQALDDALYEGKQVPAYPFRDRR